ncbi:MAG: adenosylcobinamide-GDP ribazoletransferase [Halobacteriales archaeon]
MVIAALRGAAGFLTRLPVRPRDGDFEAFRAAPWSLVVVGYVVGAAVAPVLLARPAPVAAAGYVLAIYLATGVNHADGLADLADAAAVHAGEDVRAARVDAMKDTDLGVGGALAVATAVVALALGALALARQGVAGVAGAVAAEVGAKLGLAALAALGQAHHEGLGSALTGPNSVGDLPTAVLVGSGIVVPAAAIGAGPAAGAALAAAFLVALSVRTWARTRLGGVSGDVFGAANELGRVVGVLAGAAVLAA